MPLGKLVRSNSHNDYICQIYGSGEIENPPTSAGYAFGTFVRIPLSEDEGYLVGLIYDTVLLNPDFGNLGPRLSPVPDLAVFSPDYLAEKVTLVGITTIGTLAPDGTATHGVPLLAAQIDAPVESLDDDTIRRFHRPAGSGRVVRVGYTPLLLSLGKYDTGSHGNIQRAHHANHRDLYKAIGKCHARFRYTPAFRTQQQGRGPRVIDVSIIQRCVTQMGRNYLAVSGAYVCQCGFYRIVLIHLNPVMGTHRGTTKGFIFVISEYRVHTHNACCIRHSDKC